MYLPNRSKSKPAPQPRHPEAKYKTVDVIVIVYDGINLSDIKVKSSDIDNLVNGSYQHRFLPIWNEYSGKKHLIDISNIREIVIEENEA
ncbi:hypothetical protein [Pediococcus pentosaceus]|uniref:Uncharacterized protein n=1 Tax=Pediococcus pentosaceus TaxID=1255 RepID=A0ABD7X935_PEDPE|nr:hypothetical protein [Pediococcus pentosaceus]WEA58253.1 hypothetical protein PWB86_09600 [Pediococcus pentosaceus]